MSVEREGERVSGRIDNSVSGDGGDNSRRLRDRVERLRAADAPRPTAPPTVVQAPSEPAPIVAANDEPVVQVAPPRRPAREGVKTPSASRAEAAKPLKRELPHMPADAVDRLETLTHRPDAGTSHVMPSPAMKAPSLARINRNGELVQALETSRRALMEVGWQSCAINVLMLAGPIFMLQVYDRVMTSGSYTTLAVLMAITVVVYAVIGALELSRSRLISRIGNEIDQRVGNRVFEAALRKSLGGGAVASSALRELDTLRNFVAGPAPMTAFDAMWTPIYMLVIFFTHWTLGLAGTIGAGILLFTAWLSDARSRAPLMEAGKSAARAIDLAETGQRNAEAIAAMGMIGSIRARWQTVNQEALAWQMLASDRLGSMSAFSKTLRLLLQSMMLAIGAALALRGDISAGAIIAGTIIYGRALAPVEQIIAHWRNSMKAYESYKKLDGLLKEVPAAAQRTTLPRPRETLAVEGLRVAAPETKTLILSNVSFVLPAGKLLAVIGPSASGKSTLARALVGIWQPFSGFVKLDGTRIDQWNGEDLGQHIGYLPQDIELFAGTVRDNVSRFRPDATHEEVIAAAKAAQCHDLIMALPNGYETECGAFGARLSAGQRQRVGLARALFRNPALVVLDEPNANLDRTGDEALAAAIDGMRARGQIIVMISHRVQAIGKADLLLYIERGVQKAFGPRDDVLKALGGAQPGGAPERPSDGPRRPAAAKAAPAGKTAQAATLSQAVAS